MKPSLLICCIFLSIHLNSQTKEAPALPKKLIRISTPVLQVTENDSNVVVLKMEFNGSIPKSRLVKINVKDIESISLAYSRYRLSEMFDQLTLNAQRMDKLYALMPGLSDNKAIQWYWVEQTGCDNPETCNNYFHGFVITLKSEETARIRETEEMLMEYYTGVYEGETDTKKMDSLVIASKGRLVKTCDTARMRTLMKKNRMSKIRGWDHEKNRKLGRLLKDELKDSGIVHLELVMDRKGKLNAMESETELNKRGRITKLLNEQLKITPARYMGKKIETHVWVTVEILNNEAKVRFMQKPILPDGQPFVLDKFLYNESSKIVCDYRDTSIKTVYGTSIRTTPDIILKVFDRNRQWKNCLVVTDVTGSMHPYLAQFRAWHKLNLDASSGNHDFIFFNDGDNKPDFLKATGKVGGIHYIKTDEFESLSSTLSTAMQKGGGGDCPENNIEAVLEGIKTNPDCKEVIMIADNSATPRDLSLLSKVNVPIRLILCGAQMGINTAYLDMVRKNGGSIHTMEQDIYDLSKMLDGQTIELDGMKYRLKNGNFELVGSSTVMR